MSHPKLNPKLNPFYWDDGDLPPGFRPGERVKSPIDGAVITDELYYYGLMHGLVDWRYPGKRIRIQDFIDAHRGIRQMPVYPVLSDEQMEICRKLRDPESVIWNLSDLAREYGTNRYAAALRLARWGIPTYMGAKGGKGLEFFTGDLARAISARKIDLLKYGEAELRYISHRDRDDHRRALREERRRGGPRPKAAREEATAESDDYQKD